MHKSKTPKAARINLTRTKSSHHKTIFNSELEKNLTQFKSINNAEEKWHYIKEKTYECAINTFGKRERKHQDWFEDHIEEIEPFIVMKREALIAYKDLPSQRNLRKLRKARSEAQKIARECANKYWNDLSHKIQNCADTGNIQGMYRGLKQAFGPSSIKSAPIKTKTGEIITERGQQMKRWAEHYEDLFSTIKVTTEEALSGVPELPVIPELDEIPSLEELSQAIDALHPGKSPGNDGIPAEIIQSGKPALLEPLHSLLCQCWEDGIVVQDMKDSNIITLYKNKGERSDCNNYRGISLLSIAGKVFAKVTLERLKILAERIYPEAQCGFRPERSTIDMIFSLRQLQEKCREQNRPLYIAFVDLTKAFDLVSREGLFKILDKIGCPPKLKKMIESFHTNMRGTVQFDGSTSESFPILSGVKQGCVLAPTLFGIFFSVVLNHAFRNNEYGVYLHTRSDGRLFNIRRLKAETKDSSCVYSRATVCRRCSYSCTLTGGSSTTYKLPGKIM